MLRGWFFGAAALVCMCVAAAWCCGCGLVADKDRIRVAKLGDRYITRGDMYKVLRDMSDDERPTIEKKADLIDVVRKMINTDIQKRLGDQIESKLGKPLVSREQAQQRFISLHPDENYGVLFTNVDPHSLDMSPEEWTSAKDQAEIEVDRVLSEMRGQAAVAYRAIEDFKAAKLKATDEEVQREFNLRTAELKVPERIRFAGLRFVTTLPGAETQAAEVRRRLAEGVTFDALLQEYLAKSKEFVVDSDIVNDGSPSFAGFWVNASGSQTGDIIGPVFMPAYEGVGADASGRRITRRIPDAYLVFRVLEHYPERPMTLEEAKGRVLPDILMAKIIDQLWMESGATIYEDKLPDPSVFTKKPGDPITGRK